MTGKAKYAIKVSEAYLKKKKIYVDIPESLAREKGETVKEKGSWFGDIFLVTPSVSPSVINEEGKYYS